MEKTGKKSNFYVTTAIPYVNAAPHIGFGLEIVQADTIARYQRLMGRRAFFLTGTDENSLKNVQAAEKEGTTPQELCDRYSDRFAALKEALALSNERFIRTTHPSHSSGARKLWTMCSPEDIYKRQYKGFYCVGCETFYTEKDLVDGCCPEHKLPPDLIEEENYFFRLSAYQQKLETLIESDELKIIPKSRKAEVLSFIRMGLEDFSISRSAARAKNWGIPVPGDPDQVMYVWFDALTNYMTGIGFTGEDATPFEGESIFDDFWPCDVHVIGKGITRFHAIYWPAMLLSAGIPLPKSIFVHGYLTVNGEKISKSLGNVIDPFSLSEKYGADPVRYYLLKMISPYSDGDFSVDVFEGTYNSDLANDLGNLLNRTLAMVLQNFGGTLPVPGDMEEHEGNLEELFEKVVSDVSDSMVEYRFNMALDSIWTFVRAANKYIDLTEPWRLAKEPALRGRLGTVMYTLCESIGKIGLLLSPFIPETSRRIREAVGLPAAATLEEERSWGFVDPGKLLARPVPIFPRLEKPKTSAGEGGPAKSGAGVKESGQTPRSGRDASGNGSATGAKPVPAASGEPVGAPETEDYATIDEFIKIRLTVGEVISVEDLEGADKVYKVTVDLGSETRVLASGLKPYFKPEEIVGRKVIVAANLKPRKIRGHLSRGMVLATTYKSDGEGADTLRLVSVDPSVPNGTIVS